jgi:hypothetical protein
MWFDVFGQGVTYEDGAAPKRPVHVSEPGASVSAVDSRNAAIACWASLAAILTLP